MAVDFLAKRDILEDIIPVAANSVVKAAGVSGAWSTYATLITSANMTTYFPGGFILCGAYAAIAFDIIGTDGVQTGLYNAQVAKGETGAEILVAEGHCGVSLAPADATTSVTGKTGGTMFFQPQYIPSATKLTFRSSTTSTKTVYGNLYLFGYDARYFANPIKYIKELKYVRGFCPPTQGTQVWPSPGLTTVSTHATTAWDYGTAVQFIASAASPLLITGLFGLGAAASNHMQAKIGVGAAGSEIWMSRVGLPNAFVYTGPFCDAYLPRPLFVKQDESVSVTVAGTAGRSTGIALKGFYLK
jgi:hypothetical protein